MGQSKDIKPRMAVIAGIASVVTVTILIAIKAIAYVRSDSTSVLGSLVDSIMDGGVSIMTLMAIHYSLKPADSDHRHGHGKIEGLAALLQAGFIAAAAVLLAIESIARLSNPQPVTDHMVTAIVMVISVILSTTLVAIQNYSLRHAPSLAVEADKAHYSMDNLINIGVIGVTAALYYGAPSWIDPVFGIVVALYLCLTVRMLAGKGMDMLLDRELPGEAREIITRKVLSHRHVMGMHDLRTSKSGMYIRISFDIEADPSLLLYHAHEIAREVEHELLEDFPHAEIMIHVDPYGDTEDTRHRVAGVHH